MSIFPFRTPGDLKAAVAVQVQATVARERLTAVGELDAPEVARRLLADHPTAGASPAAVVAKAAVDFCEAYGVALS